MNAHFDAARIRATADSIRAMLGDDEDAQAFIDTLDGETDALAILDRMIETYQQSKADGEALKARIGDLTARRARLNRRAQAAHSAIGSILDAIGERKVVRPTATVIRTPGKPSLVYDEDMIPTQMCDMKRIVDKDAVIAALEAGEFVPGAELVKGADSVSVRVR